MPGGNIGGDNVQSKHKGDILSFPVDGSTIIYRHALCTIKLSTGGLGHDITKGNNFVGVAEENIDNSGGSLGDLECKVRSRGIYKLPYTRTQAQDAHEATALSGSGNYTTFTLTTHAWLVGDWVTMAGLVAPLDVYNGTFRVTAVAANTITIYHPKFAYVAGTPDVGDTVDIDRTVPLVATLGQAAYIAVGHTISADQRVHLVSAVGAADQIIVGQIVRLSVIPDAYVWVKLMPGASAIQVAAT